MSIHPPGLLGASEDQPLKDAYIHAAKSTGNGFKVTAGWEVGRPVESSVPRSSCSGSQGGAGGSVASRGR